MNKILILSDNHGLKDELVEIKKRHKVDHFIHCGDSELDVDAPELKGFLKVAGNCDHDVRFPEEQTIEVGDLRILIVQDRKSTRLNSSHVSISYAVFCLKKKTNK